MNINGSNATMKTRMANLKEDLNSTTLKKLINEEEFLSFSEQILKTSNIMLVLFENQQSSDDFKLSG